MESWHFTPKNIIIIIIFIYTQQLVVLDLSHLLLKFLFINLNIFWHMKEQFYSYNFERHEKPYMNSRLLDNSLSKNLLLLYSCQYDQSTRRFDETNKKHKTTKLATLWNPIKLSNIRVKHILELLHIW